MEELRNKYAEKKSELREKYTEVINAISMARGVDVGVAFDMLLAVARGGAYLEGVDANVDIEELSKDYFELAKISEEIARANGLID